MENMAERLVLAVNVGDKVLRTFGQVQNGLQVDDLGTGGLNGWVMLGQRLQKMKMLRLKLTLFGHFKTSLLNGYSYFSTLSGKETVKNEILE